MCDVLFNESWWSRELAKKEQIYFISLIIFLYKLLYWIILKVVLYVSDIVCLMPNISVKIVTSDQTIDHA